MYQYIRLINNGLFDEKLFDICLCPELKKYCTHKHAYPPASPLIANEFFQYNDVIGV
jgi:hypothetical protein